LPQAGHVRLSVFYVLGERIRTLADRYQPAGQHACVWDGKNDRSETVSSGIYYYQIEAGHFHEIKKMILLK
jgi:flagellar hook assembly protein FlgD